MQAPGEAKLRARKAGAAGQRITYAGTFYRSLRGAAGDVAT